MPRGAYIVAKNFNSRGSVCYELRTDTEEANFYGAMESIRSPNMQILIVKGLDVYPEYAPYTVVTSAREFVAYVLAN